MFTLSFYQKDGKWTVDVDEISLSYEHMEVENIMEDIFVGVSKVEEFLRRDKKEKK